MASDRLQRQLHNHHNVPIVLALAVQSTAAVCIDRYSPYQGTRCSSVSIWTTFRCVRQCGSALGLDRLSWSKQAGASFSESRPSFAIDPDPFPSSSVSMIAAVMVAYFNALSGTPTWSPGRCVLRRTYCLRPSGGVSAAKTAGPLPTYVVFVPGLHLWFGSRASNVGSELLP
jgi:hypothetical protein